MLCPPSFDIGCPTESRWSDPHILQDFPYGHHAPDPVSSRLEQWEDNPWRARHCCFMGGGPCLFNQLAPDSRSPIWALERRITAAAVSKFARMKDDSEIRFRGDWQRIIAGGHALHEDVLTVPQLSHPPAVWEGAIRIFRGIQDEHRNRLSALTSVAERIGCTPETLREWTMWAVNSH